jgi:hypothetical protein
MSVIGTRIAITRVPSTPGLQANFIFKANPYKGAKVKTVWFRERRKLTEIGKPRTKSVVSFVKGQRSLPKGFYRCVLMVKPPHRAWKPVRAVGATVG